MSNHHLCVVDPVDGMCSCRHQRASCRNGREAGQHDPGFGLVRVPRIFGRITLVVGMTPDPAAAFGVWQPIETAPKDGSVIFVWAEGYTWPEAAKWFEYDPEVTEQVDAFGTWIFADGVLADLAGFEEGSLSHWMPLPAPPVQP
jgi:hypothetical protein